MRQIWDFHGGIHPPENKSQSVQCAIADIGLPAEIILPLNQHIGAPAHPVVKVGERVLKGQLVADVQGVLSVAVHASTSGEVVAIEDRVIAHPSGLKAPCIIIRADGLDQWAELDACADVSTLDEAALVEKIRRAGVAGMGGAGFPTAVKLRAPSSDIIDTLILNGAECEPYITADDLLMREEAVGVIQGALVLARIVGNPQNILVGIEDNKPEAIAAMRVAATGTPIEIVEIPTKYPSGGAKQLIKILTGKEVPSGQRSSQIGVLMQNVGTAYAVWRAVRYGEPLIERVTTVVGKALGLQRNIRARIGTPIRHVLEQHGFQSERCSRLIIGGPMMGYAIDDADVPIIKTTNCLLVPSVEEAPDAPPAQACIRCGLCAEVCPATLLPQQLYWYARAEDVDKLQNYNLMDCIECGACSYVCPSAIPLVQYYRASKATIQRNATEKQKADRARERFELRKERMAKAEAEKEAKRLLRKQAADLAKQQLQAMQEAATPAVPINDNSELSEKVSDNARVDDDNREQRRKKLERALSSAQSRMDRLAEQLKEYSENEARCEKIRAQMMQAQLKVDEAHHKLSAFDKGASTELSERLQKVAEKVQASPIEAQQKAIETLQKRLAVAEEKAAEAERENKPTLDALRQGVEKLRDKLIEAQRELIHLKQTSSADIKPVDAAANAAIARAQAKVAAQATMTAQEKWQEQIESLSTRVSKAREKLAQAKTEGSEHVGILQDSLDRLEHKLQESKKSLAELSSPDNKAP